MMKVNGDWLDHPATQAVMAMLTRAGHQAGFVGGCVRNALLMVPVSDIDIATDAHPEQVMALAKAAGFKSVGTGVAHGTVTVVADHIPYEITTFRKDVATDGRRATVAFADDMAEDARRRDFTMNALYAGADGVVIDPLGGVSDLQARRVRFIEDPGQRLREDYLRALRFFRFHAWYGDPDEGLDAEALAAIATHTDGLAQLSRERIGAEVLKLLAAPDPAPSVAAMRQSGVLQAVLPGADDTWLAPLVHLDQSIPANPIRRLAVLGGQDLPGDLRLSRAHTAALSVLRDGVSSMAGPAELGYRHGFESAQDIMLLRAALAGQDLDPANVQAATQGASAVFPVTAKDLMPDLSGPALGQHLKQLETRWVASGFALSAADLLGQK